MSRLLALAEVDPGDLAEATGFSREAGPLLQDTFGSAGNAVESHRLRARLRAHVARQIAVLDAALSEPKPVIDSSKVLRDLGGLKKLLDDLGSGDEGEGEPRDEPVRSDDAPGDLGALREEIARRFDRFVASGETG